MSAVIFKRDRQVSESLQSVVNFPFWITTSEQPCRTLYHALEIRLSAVVGAEGFVQGKLAHTHTRTSSPEVTAIIRWLKEEMTAI